MSRVVQVLVPALVVVCFLSAGSDIVQDRPESYKATAHFFDPGFDASLEASAWTTIAKINVYSDDSRELQTGKLLSHPCNYMFVGQDNDAPTMIHGQRDLASFARTAREGRPTEVNTLAYFMRPREKDVLVIGVGGGINVVEARTFGAEHQRRGNQRGHSRFRDEPVPRLCEMALLAEHPRLLRRRVAIISGTQARNTTLS